jgi:SAM-dependent methyltransferase
MKQELALRTVAGTLRNGDVVDFVKTSVKAGYREFFGEFSDEVCGMVDQSFDRLAGSQRDGVEPERLVEVTSALLDDTFRKSDASFWFNRIYHKYKTETKPEGDFQTLQKLLPGKSVLDYGCGSGYLDARLAKGGYQVFTTDVLDYRYEEARQLPFVQMSSATDIGYPDDSVDVALVLAVLHHINSEDLPRVIQRLRRIARYALINRPGDSGDEYAVCLQDGDGVGAGSAAERFPGKPMHRGRFRTREDAQELSRLAGMRASVTGGGMTF